MNEHKLVAMNTKNRNNEDSDTLNFTKDVPEIFQSPIACGITFSLQEFDMSNTRCKLDQFPNEAKSHYEEENKAEILKKILPTKCEALETTYMNRTRFYSLIKRSENTITVIQTQNPVVTQAIEKSGNILEMSYNNNRRTDLEPKLFIQFYNYYILFSEMPKEYVLSLELNQEDILRQVTPFFDYATSNQKWLEDNKEQRDHVGLPDNIPIDEIRELLVGTLEHCEGFFPTILEDYKKNKCPERCSKKLAKVMQFFHKSPLIERFKRDVKLQIKLDGLYHCVSAYIFSKFYALILPYMKKV